MSQTTPTNQTFIINLGLPAIGANQNPCLTPSGASRLIAMADKVNEYIHSQNGSTRSIADQIAIARGMWEHSIGPDHGGLEADDIEVELSLDLDFKVRTSLGHLVDAGVVEEFTEPGPDKFAIATWMDDGEGEIVNGNVGEAAVEGLDALADDIAEDPLPRASAPMTDGSGLTRRAVVGAALDLKFDEVEEHLRTTNEPVDVLNAAVESIEDSAEVELGDGYGEIRFINRAYQYRLTERAVGLFAA